MDEVKPCKKCFGSGIVWSWINHGDGFGHPGSPYVCDECYIKKSNLRKEIKWPEYRGEADFFMDTEAKKWSNAGWDAAIDACRKAVEEAK